MVELNDKVDKKVKKKKGVGYGSDNRKQKEWDVDESRSERHRIFHHNFFDGTSPIRKFQGK